MTVELARPGAIFLLALAPLAWRLGRARPARALLFSRTAPVRGLTPRLGLHALIATLPGPLRAAALACLVLGIAGVRTITTVPETTKDNVAIVLVLDLSSSMLADDMGNHKSRLEVAKESAARFVGLRPRDRTGLVIFSGEAITRVPLTHDGRVVSDAIASLRMGLVPDGTDVTAALLTGTHVLQEEKEDGKVLIILTDGAHNTQGMAPAQAAATAAAMGVKIYAVRIGRDEAQQGSSSPVPAGGKLETVLMQAANLSGGRYFRATNAAALDSIYTQIDRVETTHLGIRNRPVATPREHWLYALALLLLLAEWAVRGSRLGVVP